MLKERRRHNAFCHLLEDPKYKNSMDMLKLHGHAHFRKLLTAEKCSPSNYDSSRGVAWSDADHMKLFDVILEVVSCEDNSMLCKEPSDEEIKATVFSFEGDHAPGPDGFTAKFFLVCWDIIHIDLVEAIKYFFKGNPLNRAWNATFLALIPKIKKPTDFSEFRPISLCNVCYKVISKILMKRMSVLLPKLISREQGAFVSGRVIQENIAITQELVQHIDGGLPGGNLILNLDMEKAYDRLDWHFLFHVLQRFGFSDVTISLLSQCVKSNSFSVLVDGSSTEFFTSSRGLRQGDPISPFLFIIAEEVLSRGISHLVCREVFPYLVLKRCPVISHSLFADDVVIFLLAG